MSEVVIVTGGTGTIGTAVCNEFQALGFKVVVADRDVKEVPKGQEFVQCDVTDPDSLKQVFDRASTFGEVKVLVAAHGILEHTPAGAADMATISRIIDVDLKSVAYLCDIAGARMADDSSIVLISSATTQMGRVRNGYAYQASKAGVESLTRVLAVAYGPRRIRVNCLSPGFMVSPMKGPATANARKNVAAIIETIPIGRMTKAEEIAKATAFLSSKDAAVITGIVMPIDGGVLAY